MLGIGEESLERDALREWGTWRNNRRGCEGRALKHVVDCKG